MGPIGMFWIITPLSPSDPRAPELPASEVVIATWEGPGPVFSNPFFPQKKQPLFGRVLDPIWTPKWGQNDPKIQKSSVGRPFLSNLSFSRYFYDFFVILGGVGPIKCPRKGVFWTQLNELRRLAAFSALHDTKTPPNQKSGEHRGVCVWEKITFFLKP